MTDGKIAGLLVFMIAAAPCPAIADTFAPSHTCIQPVKPDKFNGNHEVTMFDAAVSNYKRCITAFVDEHYGIADLHRSAADQAIAEWNNFLKDNGLN